MLAKSGDKNGRKIRRGRAFTGSSGFLSDSPKNGSRNIVQSDDRHELLAGKSYGFYIFLPGR